MALFKILKGEQSKLPSQLNEGWAYVAKDTLTLNGHNVNFVNFYVDYDASTRLKINEVFLIIIAIGFHKASAVYLILLFLFC